MPPSYMARRMAISMSTARSIRSNVRHPISRFMKSSSSPKTDSIRCPMSRFRRMASRGKRSAPSPSRQMKEPGKAFSPMVHGASKTSIACRSGTDGTASQISALADVDFYRLLPPGGYRKGLPAALRTDVGEGDIEPEIRGKNFFPYKPRHLGASPPRPALARATNMAQKIMSSGKYDGAIFTQGSPAVEETSYWFNLLIDTTLPICGNAAQRPQGQMSNDGPANIVSSLEFIQSKIWADEQGSTKPASSFCRNSRRLPRAKSPRSMRGPAVIARRAAMAASSAASATAAGRYCCTCRPTSTPISRR